jgi:hypothetical protein
MTSPGSMPAACAGLPGNTSTTITPPYGDLATSIPSHARDPAAAADGWPPDPPTADANATAAPAISRVSAAAAAAIRIRR